MTVEQIIRSCYQAYVDKNRAALEPLIVEDFTFTSPWDDHIDRQTYFDRCWPNSENIQQFHLEKIFIQGEEAFVRYELLSKEGKRFRNTEFFRVKDGKIAEVQVYFGAK